MHKRPIITLLLGSAGTGKTRAVIERFQENSGRDLVVVPTQAYADCLAHRIEHEHGWPTPDVRKRIVTLSEVAEAALTGSRSAAGSCVGGVFLRIALSSIVPAIVQRNSFFEKTLSAPGFLSSLQQRLREWKTAGGGPDAFHSAAAAAEIEEMPELARKLRDIEAIFAAYEGFLSENHLLDEADSMRIAAERIASGLSGDPWEAPFIAVHGFYRFTRVQLELIQALAERGSHSGRETQTVMTLPWEQSRPLLFAAACRTLELLRAKFSTQEVVLPGTTGGTRRAVPLQCLSIGLFGEQTPANGEPERLREDPPIRILEAPNSYVEAEMVAREFRRLHLQLGIPWDEFAVILRSTADYWAVLLSIFERYGIPVDIQGPEDCARNPLIKTVLRLLDIVRFGWRQEDVLTFLKSSYTAPAPLDVDRLRRAAAREGERSGRDRCLALGASGGPLNSPGWVDSEAVRTVLHQLAGIDSRLSAARAEVGHFAAIVKEAIRVFGLEGRIALGEPGAAARDDAALKAALSALDGMERIAAIRSGESISFSEFHLRLRDVWENCSIVPPPRAGHVRVVEPAASHDRPIRVCAVMGLTERVFPLRVVEDPFLRDDERALIRQWECLDLDDQKLRVDDERYLFYLAVTTPTDRLLLSFPRSARENDTLPSFFIDEVRAVFERAKRQRKPADPDHAERANSDSDSSPQELEIVVRTLGDVAPPIDATSTAGDVLLAACVDLFDPPRTGTPGPERVETAVNRLEDLLRSPESGPLVRRVLGSHDLPRVPALIDARLRERFVSRTAVYTIAELETYALCPFRYLIRHAWSLRPEAEGFDSGKQSALLHGVLRRYFRERRQRGETTRVKQEPEQLFNEMHRILASILEGAPLHASAHQVQILRRRLSDDLMGFASREVLFAEQFGAKPHRFHLSFGRAPVAVAPDAASCRDPLVLIGEENEGTAAISGFIDRVDLDETGSAAIIVEYEISRPPEMSAILRGESLHLPLHMLAMERLFGLSAAAACYDSMQEQGRRRMHRTEFVNVKRFGPVAPFDDPANVKPLSRDQYADLVRAAETTAVRLANSIRSARVDATPGTHCRGCDFRDICRTTVNEGHDGEQRGVP